MPAGGRRKCESCGERPVAVPRPRDGTRLCKQCFCEAFEDEVHASIMRHGMFHRGQRVALAASGGKDSTVLIHVMKRLNDRFDYGLNMFLLSVDEGITGYRDDSLETVKRNSSVYGLDLRVVSYAELYDGWTMDRVVRRTGLKSNCTYCGVFRRSALERGARFAGADIVATGHNADDVAETVLMNLLRGDTARLSRCVDPVTAGDAPVAGKPGEEASLSAVPRCKPLVGAYEKEIVLYAFHNRLDYFSTECVYSPNAYRGFAREYVKAIEAARPSSILDTIRAGEALAPMFGQGDRAGTAKAAVARAAAGEAGAEPGAGAAASGPAPPSSAAASSSSGRSRAKGRKVREPRPITACERCGLMTSQQFCQACSLLESLEAGGGAETVDAALPMGAVRIGYEAEPRAEGARLVPASAPVVAVRGGTGVRGGPDEVLRLSGVPAGVDLRSVSWHKGTAVRVSGRL